MPLSAPKVLGQADAPVTLVEFTDLECPFCRSFHVGTFDKIKQTYIDTGRFASSRSTSRWTCIPTRAWRRWRSAAPASRASSGRCATSSRSTRATLSRETYVNLAKGLGLDTAKLDQCIDGDQLQGRHRSRHGRRASSLGVNGTPTFFVGRTAADAIEAQRIVGAQPYPVFEAQIKALLGER